MVAGGGVHVVVVVVVCEVSTKHRAPSWPPTAADRRVL